MEIEICRLNSDVQLPKYKTSGAACFDLEAAEDVVVEPGELKLISTGLVFRIPEGYFLCIAPRSSMNKHGLDMPHSFGILDPDYSGPEDEAKILVRNFTNKSVEVNKGQRLAQGYIIETPKVVWKEVAKEKLGKTSRGGYGSTGKK